MKVIYDDGVTREESEDFPAPVPPLGPGDVLVVKVPWFYTRGGEVYKRGEELRVIERTDRRPHHRWTTEGNLLISGKNGFESVWTNIEMCMHEGWLERKAA